MQVGERVTAHLAWRCYSGKRTRLRVPIAAPRRNVLRRKSGQWRPSSRAGLRIAREARALPGRLVQRRSGISIFTVIRIDIATRLLEFFWLPARF